MSLDVQVSLGYHNEVELRRAILVYETKVTQYGGPSDTFATVHSVRLEGATPQLEPGQLLSIDALRDLTQALNPVSGLELLPTHVLACSSENLVWFEPARQRVMFYACNDPLLTQLSGQTFPQPPLLFIAGRRQLQVLALDANDRPTEASPLYAAPYWNTSTSGVCLGSTSLPDSLSPRDTEGYSGGFFASAFTHGSSNLLYRNWLGTLGELWQKVQNEGQFATEHLVPLNKTLGDLLRA